MLLACFFTGMQVLLVVLSTEYQVSVMLGDSVFKHV